MKNILKTSVIAFAVCLTACNKMEKPGSGEKLILPKMPVVTSEQTNNCPEVNITLTVSSEGATEYVWRADSTVIENTTNTLIFGKNNALFPDVKVIQVAGKNASGTGLFKEITVSFTPCAPPEKPILKGRTNLCPTPFARLTATGDYATSYKWFRDGEEISGETGATLDVKDSATYTVKGMNVLGESVEESDPVTVACRNCDEAFYLWGVWTVSGKSWWNTSSIVTRSFTCEMVPVNETLFRFKNYWIYGTNVFDLYFMRDENGDYYMPISYINGISGSEEGRQRIEVTVGAKKIQLLEGNIYLDVSDDHTMFRFPQEIPTSEGIGKTPKFVIYALPAGSSEQTVGTRYFLNTDIENPIFKIPGTSGSFNDTLAPQQVKWRKSKKQSIVKGILME